MWDRLSLEIELAVLQRQIAAGEEYILKQQKLIVDFYFSGYDPQEACATLNKLRETLEHQTVIRDRILQDLAAAP